MKRIVLKPNESIEIESEGIYGQTIIVEVMDNGVITNRCKPKEE